MKLFLIIFISLFIKIANSEEFSLKWNINVTVLDNIEFIDGGNFEVNRAEGSWEDNKGYYGYLKCIGPLLIDKEKNLKLDLICDGYDNRNDKFQINLKRNSFLNATKNNFTTLTYALHRTSGIGNFSDHIIFPFTFILKQIGILIPFFVLC